MYCAGRYLPIPVLGTVTGAVAMNFGGALFIHYSCISLIGEKGEGQVAREGLELWYSHGYSFTLYKYNYSFFMW